MRDQNRTIELLAPAGSYDALRAVIEAGCDAVYIGGTRFGARAYADNPGEELLLQGIDYAHVRGVKVYLTVNTLLKQTETRELLDYLLPYYEAGLDAVIVQDFGVMRLIAEHFPTLPIHVSTQMSITDASAAQLLPKQVTRIVPARELSLEEIGTMSEGTDRELEIFVHGALCYCYSGQCLFSSLVGGRSGNRGRCAQPCRKRYRYREGAKRDDTEEAYGFLLSPKDQCLLPRVHELIRAGADSLKIEGRMKKPEYAAGVTAIYRRWLDRLAELGYEEYERYLASHAQEMADDVGTLAEIYNRGGFCEGYAFGTKGSEMLCADRPNHTGVVVGHGTVEGGAKPVALITYREEIGPEEVLELRSPTGFVCGEVTTPKDMSRFDADKPVALHWNPAFGKFPKAVEVFRTKNGTLLSEIRETFLLTQKDIPVCGVFRAAAGEPIRLTVTDEQGRACVTVEGDVPDNALQSAADAEQVLAKLRRTGGSGYAWIQLSADVGDGLFIPVSKLNELRREALAAYEEAVVREWRRSVPQWARDSRDEPIYEKEYEDPVTEDAEDDTDAEYFGPDGYNNGMFGDVSDGEDLSDDVFDGNATDGDASEGDMFDADAYDPFENGDVPDLRCAVSVLTPEQTEAAVRGRVVTDLFVDMEGAYDACLHIVRAEQGFGAAKHLRVSIVLPRVCKGKRREQMLAEAERLIVDPLVEGVVIRTPDQLAEVGRWKMLCPGLTVHSDSSMYLMNEEAGRWLREHEVEHATVSAELRRSEITQAMADGSWITVYERCPLMVSEQCPHRTVHGSGSCGKDIAGILTDMEGNMMPVQSVCRYCHSILYNAHVTSLLTVTAEVLQKEPYGVRVNCSTESRRETDLILRTLAKALAGATVTEPLPGVRYTKGHWRRGVE